MDPMDVCSDPAVGLAEACGVDPAVAHAALEHNGGDADAALTQLLGGQFHGAAGGCLGGVGGAADADFQQLLAMGYDAASSQRALSSAGSLEGALDLLFDSDGGGGGAPALAAASTGSSRPQAKAAPAAPAGPLVDDCAICQEPLRLSDAAMRCAGSGGVHHYCHAACLAQWVNQCRRQEQEPECPTCRGPLQMNRRRLRNFLENSGRSSTSAGGDCQGPRRRPGARLAQEDEEVLRRLAQSDAGAAHNDDEDGWSAIKFDQVAGALLLGAAVVAGGFLLKAAFDGLGGKRRRQDGER